MPTERPRTIVHVDLDAFYASVEQVERPDLRGKPLLVGGRHRGVVAAASYEARAYGVHSAMPMYQALTLCPHATVCHPRQSVYASYARRVMDILYQTSAHMERISIDEAFLDLTYHVQEWDGGIEIARKLQARIWDDVGLSASLGVATNKLLAKVASDRQKPAGLTVVRPGEGASFLAPLPVNVLWGVGPVTAQRLDRLGVRTVADLQEVPEPTLRDMFGERGKWIWQMARGIDERAVVTEHTPRSMGQERTFEHDIVDAGILEARLTEMCERVAGRLRASRMAARTVALKLRYPDFTTVSRQIRLSIPTNDERTILSAARGLLVHTWEPARSVRLLGVTVRDLCEPSPQISFLDTLNE
ncbi:MAG: DNA polymerase IV [Chloroflexi bacterium]|nr:DNA polymerase IV [Chloroflexota bacterium]